MTMPAIRKGSKVSSSNVVQANARSGWAVRDGYGHQHGQPHDCRAADHVGTELTGDLVQVDCLLAEQL